MKWSWLVRACLLVFLVGGLVLQPASFNGSPGPETAAAQDPAAGRIDQPVRATDQVIVRFKEPAGRRPADSPPAAPAQVERLSQADGVGLTYLREMSGGAHVYRLAQAGAQVDFDALVAGLQALPEVLYAEPDAIMTRALLPNDPGYGNQWHYFAPGAGNYGINLPAAWDITTGSNATVVAVIDTGITNHADLSGRIVPGYDFIVDTFVSNDGDGRDSSPADPGDWMLANDCYLGSPAQNSSWHGTHVAGTIAANTNNSLGVAGVNWAARILPVRVLGRCGGYLSDIVDGMRWAAGLPVAGVPANANPAHVLNMSLGGYGACDLTYQNAINDILAAGKTIVVAAGNANDDAANYRPASCSGVITVAATNRNGSRSFYSNYGAVVEISAPGGETNVLASNGILSTLNSGTQGPVADTYTYYQGTSMAAPHVAGVVSLLYAFNPSLTPAQVLQALQTTVTSFPGGSTCNTSICGSGIVNAAAALQSLSEPPPVCTNLLLDPGFEAYTPNPAWSEASRNFGTPLCTLGACGNGGGTAGPRSGNVWAWMGGTSVAETSSLEQPVAIPAGTGTLAFYLWIGSAAPGSGVDDVFTARIDGTPVFSANATQAGAYAGYTKVTVDASPFADGSVHTVRFEVSTAGQTVNFNLDDVELCGPGTQPFVLFAPIILR